MAAPRIIINAKVYDQVTGSEGVLKLAKACQKIATEFDTTIGLAPPMVELAALGRVGGFDRVRIFAQHTDALEPGAGTGWTTAEAVKSAGGRGSLVNHAEHKIDHSEVAVIVARLESLELMSLVCADSTAETKALAPLRPTYIAVEPPELIGGDTSVTSADPSIVTDAAAAVTAISPRTLTLCGAGVKTGADVAAAIQLGAYGVLLASGVVKADNPEDALRDLCSGLPKHAK
jgi:triosephosphate isomerase